MVKKKEKIMDNNDIFFYFVMVVFIIFFLFMCMIIIDDFSVKELGTEKVPCLDQKYRPFINELCTKTVTCSYFGVIGDKKCNNLNKIGGNK